MAARWGTGEDMLTACKLEYFSPMTLDESEILQEGLCSLQHNGLDTGDVLEALHGCLDPSILSIFEDSTNGEVKSGVDEESETTLLTALTEILDNVDDDNLSPFDTLPDMEVLQGQKGRELSPRHDGGENGAASFSELIQDLDVSSELDWCLPISLEQDGETVSVTLSDLVKHMHPYAMTLCVEGEEQLFPEEGIILEVMDKGEHGEPILAIPDLGFPLSLDSIEDEQNLPESRTEKVTCKHDTPSEVALSKISLVRDNKTGNMKIKQPKKESPEKRRLKKKKKWKTEETKPVERRVLRSMSSNEAIAEPSKEGDEQKRKKKVTFAPVLTVDENKKCQVESSEVKTTEVQVPKEIPSFTITTTENSPSNQVCTDIIKSKHFHVPEEKATPGELPSDKCRETAVPSEQQPGVSQPREPKQKSLSLQQYRLLRQQKKPSPLESVGDNSTKWPTLPEAPKELPPIPCLPDPSPKDPRRAVSNPVKKEFVPEIMPAWQPRGPGAPPTPQALLVPPASMLAASKKPVSCKSVSSASTKPAEDVATSTGFSTQPNPQKPPVPTNMPEDAIPNKVSQAAKQASAAITLSLPMTTEVGEAQNPHVAEQAKRLQNTPSASYQVTVTQLSALSNDQEIPQIEVVPEITTITTSTKIDTSKAASHNLNVASVAEQMLNVSIPKPAKSTQSVSATKPTVTSQRHVAPIALQPFSSAPIQARIMKLAEQMRMASVAVPKAKNPTAELIESFTSEIGIEASDLTSLLERFEETQTKEEQNVPDVCGRAAAVGNSSVEQHAETTVLKKACSPDLGSTAGLTPPATPPHQMWKPLAPVALLEKPNKSEIPKSTPTKTIQIEPLPLPAGRLQCKLQTSVTLGQIQPFSLDHDYCLLSKEPSQNELANKQPNIKSIVLPSANSKAFAETGSKLPSNTTTKESFQENVKSQHLVCGSQSKREALTTTSIVTPDASPDGLDSERYQGYSERSPSPCHQKRGRTQRKYKTRLPSSSRSTSSSSGSSESRSPPRKRYRSRSASRSPSSYRTHSRSSSPRQRRYSYSSSGSDSWSRSRSRSRSHSRSPSRRFPCWDTLHGRNQRSNYCYDLKPHNEEIRRYKEKAIEERRVVYIGRIHGSMTRKELRERFSNFGEIEECTVHFREHGDNYGFVTYYNTKDAFNAIENGSKLRQPNELPFDLCFGGRRQFCRASYADLDSNRDFDPAPVKGRVNALDFDTLLKQAQRNLKR